MAKLQMISFEDDDIIARRIKEESNYCDVAHLYVATYGICQVILQELSPIEIDGNARLTICANVEKKGDALKVDIVSTTTGEVVAEKWDDDLHRCADSRKSAINKSCWDDDTFRVYIGRPEPFDAITVELPAKDC